nr:TonB-dependent receptor [Sphingomonas sp.]
MTMRTRPGRGWAIGWLTAASLAAMSPARSADAPEAARPRTFAIEAGPLQQGLVAWAAATGVQLLYASEVVAGRTAPRLIGRFTPDAALAHLLRGTGLVARKVGERVFVLEAAPVPANAPREAGIRVGAVDPLPAPDPIATEASEGTMRSQELAANPSEIVVTGTHIRGPSPGTAPVTRIDRDDLTRNGHATVGRALQALPGNFGGTATEQSALSATDTTGTNASLATGVNLRGLGAGATLVLVNGQRLGGSGAEGAFGDVSMIPTGAFDRAEVLLDGASAIYGSDAVGGVVNILLRRHFAGAETRLRFGSVDPPAVGERARIDDIVADRLEELGDGDLRCGIVTGHRQCRPVGIAARPGVGLHVDPAEIVEALHHFRPRQVALYQFARGQFAIVEIGSAEFPEPRIIIGLVEDDLPGERVGRQGLERCQRDRDGDDTRGGDRFLHRCGARRRPQGLDEPGQGLRTA